MSKRTAAIVTVLTAIGLAVLAIPAAAHEPESEASGPLGCVEHDQTPMSHEAMEAWMAEMGAGMTAADHAQMHDHMRDMMTTLDDDAAHRLDGASMPGPHAVRSSRSTDTGATMGRASVSGGMMMGGGSWRAFPGDR